MTSVRTTNVYDTRTARFIGEAEDSGLLRALYRKRTGEFFFFDRLVDEAGGTVRPIDTSVAKEWMKTFVSKKTYGECFGAAMNEGGKKTVSIRLNENVQKHARTRAAELGISLSGYIEVLIIADLKRPERT